MNEKVSKMLGALCEYGLLAVALAMAATLLLYSAVVVVAGAAVLREALQQEECPQ